MDKKTVEEYRALQNSGVDVSKSNNISFNAGGASEGYRHIIAKGIVAKTVLKAGYRIDSETEVPRGEIDILAWGHPKRLTYAIELENEPTPDVRSKKLQQYVHETIIDDMLLIDLTDMPGDIPNAIDYIRSELGL